MRSNRRWLTATLLSGVLALSALGPLVLLGVRSAAGAWFWPHLIPPRITSDAWSALLTSSLASSAWRSLFVATLVAVVATGIALPAGRVLSQLRRWPRHAAAAAAFLPVAAPPIALGSGLQYLFLTAGLAGTTVGIALAHVVPAAGFLTLYFLSVFSSFDERLNDDARTLGASWWQSWRLVLLPAMRRQVGEALALGFFVSWSQMTLTLLIGGGVVRTLPLEIYDYLRGGNEPVAAAGALLLVVPPMLIYSAMRSGAGRTEVLVA